MRGFRKKAKPVDIADVSIVDQSKSKQAIRAAALGNAIEWFDFGVYGYVAYVLGKIFFPNASPSVQLVAALATFSVPFLFRPLGGILFGRLGDKYGRQKVLATTIILMTVSTCAIGLLPSYDTIGIWAPILLLVIKILQGVSVGGEYTGAIVFVAEYSPDRKRGFMESWLDFGSIAGFLLGAGLVSFLSYLIGQEGFQEWGWRIPFILSLPLGIVGLYLRHSLEETPAFKQYSESEQKNTKLSFKEVFAKYKRSMFLSVGIVLCTNVAYYMLLTYLPSYFTHNLKYDEAHGTVLIIAVMIGMLFVQPLIGWLSDKWGRRPFIFAGSFSLLFLSYPAVKLLDSGSTVLIVLGLTILALSLNMLLGVMASTLPALFPTAIRYSALAVSFNISIIVAGLTPTISAALVEYTKDLMIPAYYLMVFGVIGIITAWNLKETANKPLFGGTPMATNKEEAQELLEEFHGTIEERIEKIDEQIIALQKKRQSLADKHPEIE
ncbi:glycine betaine/L-proline transporter ProP [Acinetobacter rathckeae]|uniref:glycine betaine/L-proline transporter ProP n=1 Tax=Acinetobacter rathckeae TaxID=2605272 RepID=UPI0018A26D62|nr:glycine betaine/L-proline transporter ProP [Acinetobacter rathckeae]MBF7687155.1 glycine betaine/L-proline transporter ProP [Acinetobacter rathckeae]MBF7694492.1 glycine betaine/L-proline transporter ProP [Acinetobacter rathckeae]